MPAGHPHCGASPQTPPGTGGTHVGPASGGGGGGGPPVDDEDDDDDDDEEDDDEEVDVGGGGGGAGRVSLFVGAFVSLAVDVSSEAPPSPFAHAMREPTRSIANAHFRMRARYASIS